MLAAVVLLPVGLGFGVAWVEDDRTAPAALLGLAALVAAVVLLIAGCGQAGARHPGRRRAVVLLLAVLVRVPLTYSGTVALLASA